VTNDDKKNLIETAGFTICSHAGIVAGVDVNGWYALLPGHSVIHHTDDNHNYFGFFSSEQELLDEVSYEVASNAMAFHNMPDGSWDSLSWEQKLALVAKAAPSPARDEKRELCEMAGYQFIQVDNDELRGWVALFPGNTELLLDGDVRNFYGPFESVKKLVGEVFTVIEDEVMKYHPIGQADWVATPYNVKCRLLCIMVEDNSIPWGAVAGSNGLVAAAKALLSVLAESSDPVSWAEEVGALGTAVEDAEENSQSSSALFKAAPSLLNGLKQALNFIEHSQANSGKATTDEQWDANVEAFRKNNISSIGIGRSYTDKAVVDLDLCRNAIAAAEK